MKDQEEVMRYRMGKGEMDYTIGFLNRIKQQQLITTLLYMQMQKIIKRKMSQGFFNYFQMTKKTVFKNFY